MIPSFFKIENFPIYTKYSGPVTNGLRVYSIFMLTMKLFYIFVNCLFRKKCFVIYFGPVLFGSEKIIDNLESYNDV